MEYVEITSTSNTRIKEAIRIRERTHEEAHFFLVEGRKTVETTLAAGVEIREVFFTDRFGAMEEGRELLGLLSQRGARLYKVSRPVLSRLSDTETPQGIVTVASHAVSSLDGIPIGPLPLFAVVDGVQDPGNVGTIIRTADAAGADAVILLDGTCDAFMPKVIRATAGSIFNLPVAPANSERLLAWRRESGVRIVVTAAAASLSVFDADLSGPVAFVFGNEGSGVRRTIKDAADLLVKIPVYGKAESLNVATSAAICLYEAVRQRRGRQTI
jgi:TrmH family RNA methyltransferase